MSMSAKDPAPEGDRPSQDGYLARASCLICGTVVVLDPEKIEQRSDYATVPCTRCSALVPVPLADAVRAIEDQPSPVGSRERPAILGAWRRQ
jgi:hypothetical protein